MAIGMNDMLNFVVTLALVVLVAGAVGLALTSFQGSLTADSTADNITDNGLLGLLNTSSQLPTIGTIVGVAVLIGIVIGAFQFANRT